MLSTWRWVKRIFEEYLDLKIEMVRLARQSRRLGRARAALLGALGAEGVSEALASVGEMQRKLETHAEIVRVLRTFLRKKLTNRVPNTAAADGPS